MRCLIITVCARVAAQSQTLDRSTGCCKVRQDLQRTFHSTNSFLQYTVICGFNHPVVGSSCWWARRTGGWGGGGSPQGVVLGDNVGQGWHHFHLWELPNTMALPYMMRSITHQSTAALVGSSDSCYALHCGGTAGRLLSHCPGWTASNAHVLVCCSVQTKERACAPTLPSVLHSSA